MVKADSAQAVERSTLSQQGDPIWVRDATECWRAAKILEHQDGRERLEAELDDSGEVLQVSQHDILPRNATLNEDRIDDLTGLAYLNEASVLNAIKSRYSDGTIYTYSGIVLASINPYRRLPIYEREVVWVYNDHRREELAPHLFAVVEEAYQSLLNDGKSQSIIVSGESGAGKTISAKYIMRYLAELCSNGSPLLDGGSVQPATLEEKILSTNPILEAFGNAKTVKNDNSSRFGKYIKIFFDSDANITGAAIHSYLLEKTRVVAQAKEERNFHIFYQLLRGSSEIDSKELLLKDWQSYRYLATTETPLIDGIDDGEEFQITLKALTIAGFSASTQQDIFRLLSAVLHIGNIVFAEDSKGYAQLQASAIESLEAVAHLMAIDKDIIADSFIKRNIITANETIVAFNSVAQAEASRDIFAKHLYFKLFEFIIRRLNKTLSPANDSQSFIGVLDIYGFERFETNSFEQFCINYANEKLQHMFNAHVFDLEQKLYAEEEIKWSFINFANNQPCIYLIEGKLGVLDLLDEECRFPNGSDASFVAKLLESQGQTSQGTYLHQAKLSSPDSFVVKHFAYQVEYCAKHFLDKNRDYLAPELFIGVLSASSNHLAKGFMDSGSSSAPGTPGKLPREVHSQTRHSTGSLFKQSLNELMGTLYSTKVHYIRCIKPNEKKAPFAFDPPFVLQQLQACGILETIRISAAGFPGRWNFADFIERFSILADDPIAMRTCTDARDACMALLGFFTMPEDDFQVGKTKIFMRSGVLAALEVARTSKLKASARKIQGFIRQYTSRTLLQKSIRSAFLIVSIAKAQLASISFTTLVRHRASVRISSHSLRCSSKKLVISMRASFAQLVSASRLLLIRRQFKDYRKVKAIRLVVAVRSMHRARRDYESIVHIALAVQSRYRRNIAWLVLLKLRDEARSFEHMRETSHSLERRISELLHQLKLADEHLSYERTVNMNLKEQMSLTQSTGRDVKEYSDGDDKGSLITALNIEINDLKLKVESYQVIIENLESANQELFEKNEGFSKQVRALRLEKMNAERTSPPIQQQSLANIVLRDTSTPPKALRHLRMLSYDSSLSHLSHMSLPAITRPASIYHLQSNHSELKMALDDPSCLTELLQVVNTASMNGQNDFGPAKTLSLWIMSWLRIDSDSSLVQTFLAQILGQIKLVLIGGDAKRRQALGSRASDADMKMSFWITNLFEFLCFLQYAVVDVMEHQDTDPGQAPSEQMMTLMQLRTDVARVVEELCRAWLAELFRVFIRLGVTALLDHQGLSGFSSEQSSPVSGPNMNSSLRLLMLPFAKLTGSSESRVAEYSIDDLTLALGQLAKAMESTRLHQELAMQIMSAVLSNICSSAFNQLILRKSYATWKRGIQIQYNISRLEEWATSVNSAQPHYFFSASALASPNGSGPSTSPRSSKHISLSSNSPLVCVEPLIQAVKLLQLAKTRAANDIDTLIAACPRLTLAQIRKILSVYVPDAYEDGPVAADVLRNLTTRLNTRDKAELIETLPEIQPQVLPLQLSIKPIPPTPFSQLPSNMIPPHLWKVFALLESFQADGSPRLREFTASDRGQ